MKRKIKNSLICAGIVFALPAILHARVIISEVMYDLDGTDTGREWIEIENTGSETLVVDTWKLFEADTNHKITARDNAELLPGGFAIIADNADKFLIDHPGFAGQLFDSVFSLSNSGETLIIRDPNLSDTDSVSYSPSLGGGGDGHSLQKSVSGWVSSAPSPGVANLSSTAPSPAGVSSSTTVQNLIPEVSSNVSAHANQAIANVSYDAPELEVTSGRPRLGFVGSPMAFEAKVKTSKNVSQGNVVSNIWSLGEGTQKYGQFISHTYELPGEYLVVLNSESGGVSAVSKVRVKIIEPKVSVVAANSEYVEIANLDGRELNIGAWSIETLGARFTMPKDTIISPHSGVKIPATVTRFNRLENFVRIANPSGKILSALHVPSFENLVDIGSVLLPENMSVSELTERLIKALNN